MTDYEMTKHCAEIIGLGYVRPCEENPRAIECNEDPNESAWMIYCPLDDDGEAMALVKRFGLTIDPQEDKLPFTWRVVVATDGDWDNQIDSTGADLNRAIVECVAKMQAMRAQ
jgi:hypothetical protein